MCGSKLLFFWTRRRLADGVGGSAVVTSPVAPIGVNQTTVAGSFPGRVLCWASMISTRPRTVVVATWACDPATQIDNIATQIRILLSLIWMTRRPRSSLRAFNKFKEFNDSL